MPKKQTKQQKAAAELSVAAGVFAQKLAQYMLALQGDQRDAKPPQPKAKAARKRRTRRKFEPLFPES